MHLFNLMDSEPPPPATSVVVDMLPLLGDRTNLHVRQGAIEAVHAIVDHLKMDVVPYIVFLLVPVLGRMTDQVRVMPEYLTFGKDI